MRQLKDATNDIKSEIQKGAEANGFDQQSLFDLQGNIEMEMSSESHQFQLKNSTLTTGMHLFQIKQAGKMVGAGKLVIQH